MSLSLKGIDGEMSVGEMSVDEVSVEDRSQCRNIFWTQDHQWGTFGENMIFPLEKLKILRKILKNLKK